MKFEVWFRKSYVHSQISFPSSSVHPTVFLCFRFLFLYYVVYWGSMKFQISKEGKTTSRAMSRICGRVQPKPTRETNSSGTSRNRETQFFHLQLTGSRNGTRN